MALFIRGSNPVWSFVDLTGHQFDDTFYMFVLENDIPYFPANVYHDENGAAPWTQPIQFFANGTLPIDIFFDPSHVYRLEFRHGPTQADPLIYLVEDYVPGETEDTPITGIFLPSDNQITNSQFSLVNFTSPYVLTLSAQTLNINIAPGWELNLVGTGTATINQVPLNDSATTINPTNAPYALELNLSGSGLNATLSQRFQQNGMLWSNKFVSSSITAKIIGAIQNINAQLIDSNGTVLTSVLDSVPVNGTFNEFLGFGHIGATTNPDLPPAAYVDYILFLPQNVDIFLTSFQLASQNIGVNLNYTEDTIDRQIDYTFHDDKPKLEFKPIKSYLIGWDFPLNPSQNGNTVALGAIGANKSAYVWDQTILFSTVSNTATASRNTNNNLLITTSAPTQVALVQYMPAEMAYKILSNDLSVNIICQAAFSGTATVSLWWTQSGSLPNINSGFNNSLVTGLDVDGFPTVVGGWNELKRDTLQHATFVPASSLDDDTASIGFSGWSALVTEALAQSATFFAIVVGTSSIPTSTIQFGSISLVPGRIPTIPAPQTVDEVLSQCQYYYETSFSSREDLIANPTNNLVTLLQTTFFPNATTLQVYASPGSVVFKNRKYKAPIVTLISQLLTNNNLSALLYYGDAGVFTTSGPTDTVPTAFWDTTVDVVDFYFTPKSLSAIISVVVAALSNYNSGEIRFHFVADARLGAV
jgi:hypothetical protein